MLLLKVGDDCHRIQQVVSDICPTHAEGVKDFVGVPIVIARKMSLDDVMAGQFALACCDCVSAFVVDEVVDDGNAEYLLQLSEAVKNSDEFEVVAIKLILIPTTEAGRHFSWQFLGTVSYTHLTLPTICSV